MTFIMKKFFILIFVFYVNLFSQIPEIKSEAPTKELGIKFDDLLKQAQTFQYPVKNIPIKQSASPSEARS